MISFEEIQKYLPQYLSSTDQDQLFLDIRKFPNNIDYRFYSAPLTQDENIYQGDGINELLVINLPSNELKFIPSMILSNTCDIDQDNKRLFSSRALYSPIFQLDKYRNSLISDYVSTDELPMQSIEDHIDTIKRQEVTQILYLPVGCGLMNESIVFLDRINNCPSQMLNKDGKLKQKIFTLSNFGFYVLMIKLSIHFTRIREGVNRLVA